LAVILVALPLGAGTINVSAQFAAVLDTGDALSFTVPSSNFGANSANFGLPVYPTDIGFVFVSAPVDSPVQFDVVLESGDDSVSVLFDTMMSFVSGTFRGSRFSGAVSVLEGSLHLSEAQSQELFGSSPAVLTLLNTGPALSVGLPPYTLQQDMNVSLGGGGLSVGALPGGVTLADAPMGGGALMDSDPANTPEPRSGLLLLGGGALLCGLSRLRRSKLAGGAQGGLERDSDKLAASSHASLLK
jgi:hypothetical protein